ncbi:hypothetical protein ABID97_005301 [Variovorax sp. OAS795]|uniref:ABC transporter ATP-binding protein n=1 Tax=Variovorax sp. OAS795 TaxID=3034231 RepID=UPI00339402A5
MKKSNVRLAATVLATSACFSPVVYAATSTEPGTEASWELVVAPFTHHWRKDSEHRHVVLLGLERIESNGSTMGGALFRNSFGQLSAYAYYGHEWDALMGAESLYFKLSGGIIYGYRGRYKDKVPLNVGGFSPAIIPAIGWRFTPKDAIQAAVLGKAGVTFSYDRRF